MVTGVISQHPVVTVGSSFAPPRVGVVSGLVRQNNFVPVRRFHEDGREALMLTTGGWRQNRYSWAPAVPKQTKPGDSLRVLQEPVVPIYLEEKNTIQILDGPIRSGPNEEKTKKTLKQKTNRLSFFVKNSRMSSNKTKKTQKNGGILSGSLFFLSFDQFTCSFVLPFMFYFVVSHRQAET